MMANVLYYLAQNQNISFLKESLTLCHCFGELRENLTQEQAATWETGYFPEQGIFHTQIYHGS